MNMPNVSILTYATQYHANQNTNYSEWVQSDLTFGDRIRVRLKQLNMKESELAHRVGVTENAIRQMELGYTKRPSFVVGLKIAHVLGVSPWALAGEVDPGTVSPRVSDPEDVRMARLEERVDALTRDVRQSTKVDLDVAKGEYGSIDSLLDTFAK